MAEIDASIPLRALVPQQDVGGLMEQRAQIQLRNLALAKQQRAEEMAQQQTQRRQQIGQMAAAGDYAGADKAALGAGDFDLHGTIKGLQDEQRAAVAGRITAAAPIAYAAMTQAKDPMERARLISGQKAFLVAKGWQPQEIDAFISDPNNLTDQGLSTFISTAQTVKEQIDAHAKANESFTLGPGDRRFDASGREIAAVPSDPRFILDPVTGEKVQVGGMGAGGGTGGVTPVTGRTTGGWTPRARHGGDNSDAAVDGKIAGMSRALGVPPTADISSMNPLQIAQALTLSEGGRGSLADRNNNPANIKNPDGTFKKFPTREAGLQAAAALVQRKLARGQTTIQTLVEGIPAGGKTRAVIDGPPQRGVNGVPREAPPSGYRWTATGDLEPIPNGPADPGSVEMPAPKEMAKRNAVYPKVSSSFRAAMQKIDTQIRDLTALRDHRGLAAIVGAFDGRTPAILPQSAAAKALLDKVLATGQFAELQDMRNNSPTGGALGNVSDSENKTLRQAVAALDRTQGEAEFKQAINDYISALQFSKGNLTTAYEDTYAYRNQRSQPSVSSVRNGKGANVQVRRWNP